MIIEKNNRGQLEKCLSQAREAERNNELIRAGFFYRSALVEAAKLQDSKEIKRLKIKMKNVNKRSFSEYKKVEFSELISTEEIEKIVNSFFEEKDLSKILKKIQKTRFIPKVSDVKEQAESNMPAIYPFATLETVGNDGNLVKGGSEPRLSWFSCMYAINTGVQFKLTWLNILRELKNTRHKEKRINADSLLSFLSRESLLDSDKIDFLKLAFDRYFKGDYVSALHILIPQFENLFIRLSEKAGIDVIRLNQEFDISTQSKTLNTYLLKKKEFLSQWGEDLCKFIDFVLFDPLGYNLRNKISHGEIDIKDCNEYNSSLIIYLLIFIFGSMRKQWRAPDLNALKQILDAEYRDSRIISIDGGDGVGKTKHLSPFLAKEYGYETISIDEFLIKEQGEYKLNEEKIKEFIKKQEKDKNKYIIEGIKLLEFIGKYPIKIDCYIYVKRVNEGRDIWEEEEMYSCVDSLEEIMKKENEFAKCPRVREEVIKYHYAYKPHQKADIIFLNHIPHLDTKND